MNSLFFLLYRAIAWPLMKNAFKTLSFFNAKIRRGLEMRERNENGVLPWLACEQNTEPIWIHCASGEFEYAKPVITRLKRQRPDLKIMVTYFSPSFAQAIQKFPGVDFSCPLPWDEPHCLRSFIQWHNPKALLIARTDTWPEMLRQAKHAGLPSLLFSATLPANSGRARGLGRWMSAVTFSFLDQIDCVSDEDLLVFESLGVGSRARLAGDTRYDQVIARLESPKPLREELFADADRSECFVAGSTWSEDEVVLIKALSRFKSPLIRLMIAPHEPSESHLRSLETALKDKGFQTTRYTKAESWSASEVLLIDKVGILAELYLKSRYAFVGGSFRKTVHSVMEPLAAGCLTWVGPRHQNNREALYFKTLEIAPHLKIVNVCHDAMVLAASLGLAMQSQTDFSAVIQKEIVAKTGQSERVVEWVQQHAL